MPESPHSENHPLMIRLLALLVTAITIFLAISLIDFDPADPPYRLVYPQNASATNLCGPIGAACASRLLNGLGLGAHLLLLPMAFLSWRLWKGKAPDQPVLRSLGLLMILTGLCGILSLTGAALGVRTVFGPGGVLGATLKFYLDSYFAKVGSYILLGSLTLAGALLACDYTLMRILLWVFGIRPVGLESIQRMRKRFRRQNKDDRQSSQKEAWAPKEELEHAEPETAEALRVRTPTAEPRDAGKKRKDKRKDKRKELPREDTESAPGTGRGKRLLGKWLTLGKQQPEEEDSVEETDFAMETLEDEDPYADYELPPIELLTASEPFSFEEYEKTVRRQARLLEKTFADFGFSVRVVEIQTGPVIAQFEIQLERGLRLSRIMGLADDLAIALKVPSVRIVAPIPGKNTVGIEIPNADRQLVRLREVMEETAAQHSSIQIPIYLGKDVSGSPMTIDLAKMPHLLIAGRTGTGKSVCLNSLIVSILMTRRPDEVRMLLIDPKMVELSPYKTIPHLMHPVVTDMRKAEAILAWAVDKMEERYQHLARAGVRHLSGYNALSEEELYRRVKPETDEEWETIPRQMPYIVIVADEMADLMMTSAKEVETHIIRLAQKSRAVGIHLVLATQKPTVDIITGLIKSNLPARICFEVASRTDSRVVLDEMGADKLLGNGDMLFLRPGTSTLIRGQGTYVSDEEINEVIASVATEEPEFVEELVELKTENGESAASSLKDRDELYSAAVEYIISEGRGSVSLLQRKFSIGYGRAARMIDFMSEDGIVGPYNGSQAREVTMTLRQWQEKCGSAEQATPSESANGGKKIVMKPIEEPEEMLTEENLPEPFEIEDAEYSPEEENDQEEDASDDEEEFEDDVYDEYDEEEGDWEEEDEEDQPSEEPASEETSDESDRDSSTQGRSRKIVLKQDIA